MPLRPQRVLFLLTVLALLGAGCGDGATLSAKALAKKAESLQSQAAEGALLARDAVDGKTTRIYTRVHGSDLHKAASEAQTSLAKARTEPALEPKLRRLAALAASVTVDLDRLGEAPQNEQRRLARNLETAAHQSGQIAEALG